MMVRGNAGFRRFRQKIEHVFRQALISAVCAACLSAASAAAAPYAQPGQAYQSGHEWAAQPLIRAGLCPDGQPCPPGYEPSPYADPPVYARNWKPEPAPYPYEGPAPHAKPDCPEERYAVHGPVVAHEPRALRRSKETYEEPCGIRCWYARLRAGYCGRGCDYYRFRMTQFPEGRLGDRVHVACR
jgi:hypothetical protein